MNILISCTSKSSVQYNLVTTFSLQMYGVVLTFRHVCVVVKSAMSICLSVRLHVISLLRLDGFSWNLIMGALMKICPGTPNLVEIGQKYWAHYMKT